MTDGDGTTRRQWLATCAGAAGVSLLAGCQSSGSSGSSGTTDIAPQGWPMHGGGPANTRHRPEATGPTERAEEIWSVEIDRNSGFVDEAAVVDGTAYISGLDEVVRAFDGETGETLWETSLETYGLSTPLVVDDAVYVGSAAKLIALDRSDGTVRWTETVDMGLDARISYYDGDIYCPAAHESDDRNTVLKLDPETRETERLADFETGAITGTPAIANDTLYLTSATGVHAVDVGSGSSEWQFEAGELQVIPLAPAVADGTVYAIAAPEEDDRDSKNSALLALDASSGTERWRYSHDHVSYMHRKHFSKTKGNLAIADGTVFLPAGRIRAIDAETGERRWTSSGGVGSAAVVDGVLYGTKSSRLVGVDPSDGSVLWESEEVANFMGNGTVVSGGRVYQPGSYWRLSALE